MSANVIAPQEMQIPMYNTTFLVKIANTLCNLENHMSCEILTEIRQLDDLVEQFTALHDCVRL